MVRLYLFAEGQTEQTFADNVLKPHLANSGVYLHKPILIATARRKRHVFRGGGHKYAPMKSDILRLLKQEHSADVFFTTMIDLYAIHSDFPGLADAEKLRSLPQKRVEFLENAFGQDLNDARFLPFIQLHEFEAYLFVSPSNFEYFYDDSAPKIANLLAIATAHQSPELIDDGISTAPSKRIIAQFPDYADAKPIVGPQVAELTGLSAIRDKCAHFAEWLSRLEKLA